MEQSNPKRMITSAVCQILVSFLTLHRLVLGIKDTLQSAIITYDNAYVFNLNLFMDLIRAFYVGRQPNFGM